MEATRRTIFKRCRCGLSFSLLEWCDLPSRGAARSADETGEYEADMRDCPCGSTIAVEFKRSPDGTWRVHGR
jgi:hypothetical protein